MGYDLHGWIKDFREEDGINSILVRLMNFLLSHHSLKVNDSDASVRLTIIGVDHQKKKGLGNDITKVQLGGKKHRANRKRPNTRHWRLTEAANSLVTSTSYIAELNYYFCYIFSISDQKIKSSFYSNSTWLQSQTGSYVWGN